MGAAVRLLHFSLMQYLPAGVPRGKFTLFFLASLALFLSAVGSSAVSEPLFHWGLADGANVGTASMADLTIDSGTEGIIAFSEDGLDSTQTILGNTTKSGVAIGNLGSAVDLSKFTITFWVKTPLAQVGYQNILVLLPASENQTESRLLVRYKSSKSDQSNKLEVMVGGQEASGIVAMQEEMTPTPNEEWRFFAISYDGTSTRVNNSEAQGAATSRAENRGASNLQIYQASENSGDILVRQGFNWGKGNDQWSVNYGPLMLGANASIFLANQADFTRGLVGQLKDVRIYNDVLSVDEIENVRSKFGSKPKL